MIWMWMSSIVILVGAELNSEIEHRLRRTSRLVTKSRLGNAARQWRIRWARKLDKITDLRGDTVTLTCL